MDTNSVNGTLLPDGHLDEESLTADMGNQREKNMIGGGEGALADLYERYARRVHRYAIRMTGDEDAAQDVVQETFLRVQTSLHTLRNEESLEAWLFRIARNQVFTMLRQTRSGGGVDPEELQGEGTPLEELIRGETAGIVRRMVAALKPEFREVIVLREYEELSYAEIASIIGESEDVVGMRLLRARKALARLILPYIRKEDRYDVS